MLFLQKDINSNNEIKFKEEVLVDSNNNYILNENKNSELEIMTGHLVRKQKKIQIFIFKPSEIFDKKINCKGTKDTNYKINKYGICKNINDKNFNEHDSEIIILDESNIIVLYIGIIIFIATSYYIHI